MGLVVLVSRASVMAAKGWGLNRCWDASLFRKFFPFLLSSMLCLRGLQSNFVYKVMAGRRSQLFGRGVDFAESIFSLARLAESIFRDVMNLKF